MRTGGYDGERAIEGSEEQKEYIQKQFETGKPTDIISTRHATTRD
jgi:hypothetical protein